MLFNLWFNTKCVLTRLMDMIVILIYSGLKLAINIFSTVTLLGLLRPPKFCNRLTTLKRTG